MLPATKLRKSSSWHGVQGEGLIFLELDATAFTLPMYKLLQHTQTG
jgi:hypothetical protein